MEHSGKYKTLYEKWDYFVGFIEKGLNLLKEGGYLSLIVSNSFNTSKYANKIKEHIIKHYTLKQIDFFKEITVFKGVGVESVIILIQKKAQHQKTRRILHTGSFDKISELEPSDDIDTIFRISTSIDFNKKFNNTELLGNICFISKGMVIHSEETNYKGQFTKDDLISDKPSRIHTRKYVEGKDLERYRIRQIKYLEWNTNRVPKKLSRPTFEELYTHPKIIRGRTTEGTYDDGGLLCNESACVFVPYIDLKNVSNRSIDTSIKKWNNKNRKDLETISLKFEIKYVLAILNSKFGKFFLNTIRRHRIEYYFYSDDFKKLPIKIIPVTEQRKFVVLVDKMLSLCKKLNELNDKHISQIEKMKEEIRKVDNEIDDLVYDLYTLSKEERGIIEESLE